MRTDSRPAAPPAPAATASAASAQAFSVAAISLPEHARIVAPVPQIVVAFNHEVDASLINFTTLRLERLTARGAQPAGDPLSLRFAAGDPRVVLITPGTELGAGMYRLTVRGTGGGALADVNATVLGR